MEISNGHYQAMASHPLAEIIANCPKQHPHQNHPPPPQQNQNFPTEKKPRPHPDHALKCPRCESNNTKFCYYNNYSLSQPRYFCKGCRRYWTQGGSLRTVPVGGGSRKNRRPSSSSTKNVTPSIAVTTTAKAISDQSQALAIPTALGASSLPALPYDHRDLVLAFAGLPNYPTAATHGLAVQPGLLEFLRDGYIDHNYNQNPAGFHNFYYGNTGGVVDAQEMVLSIDHNGGLDGATTTGSSTPTTSVCQGSCELMDGIETRKMVMGVQWQLGSDGNIVRTADDSASDVWSNGDGGGGSWHGLINSSLM